MKNKKLILGISLLLIILILILSCGSAPRGEATRTKAFACKDYDADLSGSGKDYLTKSKVVSDDYKSGKEDHCGIDEQGKEVLFEGNCRNYKYYAEKKDCSELGKWYKCKEGRCQKEEPNVIYLEDCNYYIGFNFKKGMTYKLIGDINQKKPYSPEIKNCFDINEDEVIFDCEGKKISLYSNNSIGINVVNRDKVTIKNCVIKGETDFFKGGASVRLLGVTNSEISGNTFEGNLELRNYCMGADTSSCLELSYNKISNNQFAKGIINYEGGNSNIFENNKGCNTEFICKGSIKTSGKNNWFGSVKPCPGGFPEEGINYNKCSS
jgi:hypothetical protein